MQKMYYSISEVSKLTGLAPHVLRYWETEFKELRPRKNRAGSRSYRDQDVTVVRVIQTLLHVERYTIEGARRELAIRLESMMRQGEGGGDGDSAQAPASARVVSTDASFGGESPTVSSPAPFVTEAAQSSSVPSNLPVDEIKRTLREILDLLG